MTMTHDHIGVHAHLHAMEAKWIPSLARKFSFHAFSDLTSLPCAAVQSSMAKLRERCFKIC